MGFRKKPSLIGKSDANECNENSLSNCRVQLVLSTKKDGMILEKLISAKGSLSLMQVCIASSLTTLNMLLISLNLQQS